MNIRETFTYFKFVPVASPGSTGNIATAGGTDINRQGYDSLTFTVNLILHSATTLSDVSAPYKASCWFLRLQHTDASALAAGPSDYADVGSIDVIRNWSGAMTSGICYYTLPSTMSGSIALIGYRGNKQYVRAYLSHQGTIGANAGSNIIAVEYFLGHAENWPVTVPNLDA